MVCARARQNASGSAFALLNRRSICVGALPRRAISILLAMTPKETTAMRRQLVWSFLVLLIGAAFAVAQETTTGSIAGQVVDAQGAPVPGATVTLTSNQGSKTFVTDGQGRFFAPYLTPGTYSVRAELAGFSPVEQKNVTVRLGQRVELSGLVLKVGGLEEVVEVVGAAPVIDTSSTTGGAVLDSESLKRIPVGRNFTDTLYLVAGVSSS